jgi:choline kinase
VRFVDNPGYRDNNILQSLFCADAELDAPFLFSYADIVFTDDVVRRLAAAPGDICLVVDRRFRDVYVGRTEHPLAEAEVCAVGADGRVTQVGKRALPPEQAAGEFIGLAKLSAAGAAAFTGAWRQLARAYAGREETPFVRAPRWRTAYVTDLLQHLIDGGVPVTPVFIDGDWREIDTVQDLARAEAEITW